MKKIYLLLISAIISVGAFAQFVPIIDNAGTSGNIVVGSSNYHASESIYLDAEIGHNNFTTAGSAIQQIFFFLEIEPLIPATNNFKISMKNIAAGTTTLATGTYSTAGYTVVFNGTLNATTAGLVPVILTAPFVHTSGSNIEVLIERTDNVIHGDGVNNNVYDASVGNINNPNANTTRRYNGAVALSATTTLTASIFRESIAFNHTFPIDAVVNDIILPPTSCFSGPQSVSVEILNGGTTNIAAGTATTTLHIRGANTFTGTLTNTGTITPGSSEFITFNGVSLNNLGDNFDTAYVHLTGDGTTYYDTLSTVNDAATTISSFPVSETVEELYPITPTSTLDVFTYVQNLQVTGADWTASTASYSNGDQTTSLAPLGSPTDSAYYFFDSYDFPAGSESRLFSNCINLTSATAALLTFWTNHDNTASLLSGLDSLYVSVSADHGATWTRLQGFQRPDASVSGPVWRMESVNLSAYLGQTIQIGFEAVSNFGNAILLDNITIAATLPVSVLSFNAQRNGKVNDLKWRTAQEQNSSKFIIERSTDGGRNFTDIGQVAAAGNSNTERNYSFTDIAPIKGFNYYRLRIVDINNSFKYSDIKNVRNTGTADFSFAPNPVQQQMKINLDADKSDKGFMTITDMSGKQVYSSTLTVIAGSNDILVETGKFAQGSYIINIQLSDDRIVKKFTKL